MKSHTKYECSLIKECWTANGDFTNICNYATITIFSPMNSDPKS